MSNYLSQSWQCVHVPPEKGYDVYQHGCHLSANFIRVYVPEEAKNTETKLKAIIYLHGFALCMPSFYEAHLIELVKKGYIVFFPDYQYSFYPNTPPQGPTPSKQSLPYLQKWRSLAKLSADTLANANSSINTPSLTTDDIDSILSEFEAYERGDLAVKGELSEFSAFELRRVARAMIVITIILMILSWFRREYSKNLIHLLSTVALSLVNSPEEWLENAITRTEHAWEYLSQQDQYLHWNDQNKPDTFAFGHSLGGLLALSLPFHLEGKSPESRFFPKKIVVADPTPNTENGIPKFVICILKLFCVPFVNNPIKIKNTGKSLTEPVAILHGNSDELVPPSEWVGGKCSNYDAINSEQKAIYFSYSNDQANPKLVAFHNQAVTSTQYYGDGLFKHFGGVKNGPNAYNINYVWPGADKIFAGETTPEDLLDHLHTPDFQVQPTPSKNCGNLLTKLALIFGIILLLGVAYWIGTKVGLPVYSQ
ncbi:MAG: hypothetical protein F6K65_24655 [Moorea sp. SIO3C2]|nr:hypothetical protein [Moorena sp. SIO3C2]